MQKIKQKFEAHAYAGANFGVGGWGLLDKLVIFYGSCSTIIFDAITLIPYFSKNGATAPPALRLWCACYDYKCLYL